MRPTGSRREAEDGPVAGVAVPVLGAEKPKSEAKPTVTREEPSGPAGPADAERIGAPVGSSLATSAQPATASSQPAAGRSMPGGGAPVEHVLADLVLACTQALPMLSRHLPGAEQARSRLMQAMAGAVLCLGGPPVVTVKRVQSEKAQVYPGFDGRFSDKEIDA